VKTYFGYIAAKDVLSAVPIEHVAFILADGIGLSCGEVAHWEIVSASEALVGF
jgi:hypothetical protein